MADNTILNAGASGDVIASDDIGGVKFQRVKLVEGADGVNDGDISAANPLPVTAGPVGGGTEAAAQRVTVASDSTGNLAVKGDVAHDAADSGNPLKVGSKAANALPTAVANNDRANAISDLFGRLLVGHIDPAMQTHINKTYTTTQTGTDVWDPAAGKKIAVTSVVIGAYGTTAGRVILWFGDNADTTFSQDTDQVLVAASFAPSATSKPGLVFTPSVPVFCNTADRELHITTDAAISIDVTIEGYEFS